VFERLTTMVGRLVNDEFKRI